jgi:hypothetical protein
VAGARLQALAWVMTRSTVIAAATALASLAFAPSALAELNPPPPDFYTCNTGGGGTICRAQRVEHNAPAPTDITCGDVVLNDQGDVYEDLTRRYDADGNWVERVIRDRWLNAMWSNPVTGNVIPYTQRGITTDRLTVPGDESTIVEKQTGENQYTDPVTHKKVLHVAGQTVFGPDGLLKEAGQQPFIERFVFGDASAFDDLCAALAR